MNHYLYAFIALDIARQRSREAEARWLEASFTADQPTRAARLRRGAALLFASVSRGTRGAVLGDRRGHLAKGIAHGVDPVEVLGRGRRLGGDPGAGAIGALAVDHTAIDEPAQCGVERGELLDRETIVRVEGVQEVEGALEIDAMGVAEIAGRRRVH